MAQQRTHVQSLPTPETLRSYRSLALAKELCAFLRRLPIRFP